MADLITNLGKALYTAAVVALGATSPKYVAWGIGSGQSASSTALASAAAPTTVTAATGTIAQATTTTTNDTVQVVATITAASSLAITEVASFNSATLSGATMVQYGDFAAVNVVSGDSIAFTLATKLS